MGELAEIRRYSYWSDRRIRGIAADNAISLEPRWLFGFQIPSVLGFLPQAQMLEQRRTMQRHEVALKLERAVGQLAVEDFITPPPARFVKGCGPVTLAAYTRWRPRERSERKGIIVNTSTVGSDGRRVEICLFGSIENCADYLAGSNIEAPIWSSSSTWAIEDYIANRGATPAPIYDDEESIAVEIVRVFNNEGMTGEHAFKRIRSAEWFAEVYSDIELDEERWNQQLGGDWPHLINRIVIGAPLWVRFVI